MTVISVVSAVGVTGDVVAGVAMPGEGVTVGVKSGDSEAVSDSEQAVIKKVNDRRRIRKDSDAFFSIYDLACFKNGSKRLPYSEL